MNSALAEASLALTGTLRLARGDPGGLACFDPSIDGFWRSFRAAVLCYPPYLILLSFPVVLGDGPVVEVDTARFYAAETIHFAISWVAFPLVVLPIADFFGRGDRFLIFITAYNWCQVPQTLLFAIVALLGGTGVLSPNAMLSVDLILGIAALAYEWFVARVALAVTGPRASVVILADVILAVILSHISRALY
ncbi:MAG TPA: hypothetical protein VGR70_16895 [Stellaceae bacterium]|nr:hypothetical protein [Stellaceae bacterium]